MEKGNSRNVGITIMCFILAVICIVLMCYKRPYKTERDLKEEVQNKEELGKYFLVDEFDCLHKTDCFALRYSDDRLHKVKYIKKEDLKKSSLDWYCPSCISVEVYEAIQKYKRGSEAL